MPTDVAGEKERKIIIASIMFSIPYNILNLYKVIKYDEASGEEETPGKNGDVGRKKDKIEKLKSKLNLG